MPADLSIICHVRLATVSQSIVASPTLTPILPNSFTSCTAFAAVTITFVGIQPRVRHVPPNLPFSMIATFLPVFIAASATMVAPPVPTTIISYCFMLIPFYIYLVIVIIIKYIIPIILKIINIENILFLLLVKVGARVNFHKKKRRPHGSSCSI